jgi:hypothetical protein
MESLLTLSVADYRVVELVLRLTVALSGMCALLMALSAGSLPATKRLALLLPAVALGAATWFESETWQAWKEAFELAGSSYAVSGHSLAPENQVIAWSLGVPSLLLALGMARIPWGKSGDFLLERLAATALVLSITSLFYRKLGLLVLLYAGFILCLQIPRISIRNGNREGSQGFLGFGFIVLGTLVLKLASKNMLPLGNSAETILIRGEIIRSLCLIVCLCVPAVILLIRVLRQTEPQSSRNG